MGGEGLQQMFEAYYIYQGIEFELVVVRIKTISQFGVRNR